jgi:hypothetical protein
LACYVSLFPFGTGILPGKRPKNPHSTQFSGNVLNPS